MFLIVDSVARGLKKELRRRKKRNQLTTDRGGNEGLSSCGVSGSPMNHRAFVLVDTTIGSPSD